MVRDSERTRQRILDAATAEFAERGIAGARVDRIAASAQCNKALLYTHFGSKDGLFDAVFAGLVTELVSAVPIDADRIDEYAGRVLDHYTAHPQLVRLALWDRLERGGAGMGSDSITAADAAKVAAIAAAQARGSVSARFAPETALALVVLLTSLLPLLASGWAGGSALSEGADTDGDVGGRTALRDVVTTAVRRLLT